MSDAPRWITEADVVELIDLPDAIDAVEQALAGEAGGGGRSMDKTHLGWEGGHGLHALGGWSGDLGLVATKTWAHTDGGASPLLVLWDLHTGSLRAVMEAFALGQLRTASVTAVATRWLAPAEAEVMAMIGSGRQARAQVAAVAAVRSLAEVRVFSPTPAHRRRFVEELRETDWAGAVVEAPSVEAAVDSARVVTTATRSRSEFLSASSLAAGGHVNALGAIVPEGRELAADVLERCTVVVADSPEAAQRLSSELDGAGQVVSLAQVVGTGGGRPAGADLTLFKAMGIGLADLAVGAEVARRAQAHDVGRPLPHRQKAAPRLGRPPAGALRKDE